MDDGSSWVLELEEALLDEAPPDQLKLLLAGRALPASLRADVWSHCLEIAGRKSRLDKFDDVYDHQDQAEIRAAARGVVERVAGAGDRFQLQADAEAILTVHFKSGGQEQRFSAAEASLLGPVIDLSLTRNEKFSIFQTVLERFIPRRESHEAVYDLARLLLLYHDPQLCNHLDSLKISFQEFSGSWFSR